MRLTKYHALFFALSLSLNACSNGSDTEEKAPPATTHKTEAAAPAGSAHTPQIADPKSDAALSGTVLETFDSGGYTYLQLDNGHEKIWAAISSATITVGQQIALINGPVMKDFHSRSLDRTFPEIIFSAGIKGQQTAKTEETKSGANPHGAAPADAEASFMSALKSGQGDAPIEIDPALASGGSIKAIVNYQEIKVDKITDGYQVVDIFTSAADLNGKTVKVRGKVVKVSPNIMGSNWLHIQDGSGDPMHNTHDLVVTSEQLAKEGDVIVVEGVMAAKKDFGAGYFYEAIIEQAKISK